jgi:hypothetical protein
MRQRYGEADDEDDDDDGDATYETRSRPGQEQNLSKLEQKRTRTIKTKKSMEKKNR